MVFLLLAYFKHEKHHEYASCFAFAYLK